MFNRGAALGTLRTALAADGGACLRGIGQGVFPVFLRQGRPSCSQHTAGQAGSVGRLRVTQSLWGPGPSFPLFCCSPGPGVLPWFLCIWTAESWVAGGWLRIRPKGSLHFCSQFMGQDSITLSYLMAGRLGDPRLPGAEGSRTWDWTHGIVSDPPCGTEHCVFWGGGFLDSVSVASAKSSKSCSRLLR